jgi:galactose mutarotase-like enzyme
VLTLHNGMIDISIDVEHGAAITRLSQDGQPNVLAVRTWDTPAPPNPVQSYGDDTSDFLASYAGGWHVLFPNAGDACEVAGVHLPFHGDTARAPWQVVSADDDSVVLRCPTRLPVILERTVTLLESAVQVEETALSDAPIDVPVIWGHHPVFAARPGMRIDLPGGSVNIPSDRPPSAVTDVRPGTTRWPLAAGHAEAVDLSSVPEGAVERFASISHVPAPWAAVRDPASGSGIALSWDREVFSSLWIWLQIGGSEFPWFGRTSYLGIEPQSTPHSRGLAAAVDGGQALVVPAGGRLSAWVTMSLFAATDAQVTSVSRSGLVTVSAAA